ncbi:L,D-transpeptidase family protein [Modicisalibacter radicis]|uniref:L,D-transpeptidase family protein n=1 Tax=Halomonas sp. EAR18 TaxID=2518972 RepID=UPI00109C32AE|nr:L,D-transpeptidase family protein [Halomonas sp. EAR18]
MRKRLGGRALLLAGLLALSRLTMAQAAEGDTVGHYPLPEAGDLVGQVQTVSASGEDTLIDIGLRHGVGYNGMVRANPQTNVWVPGEGTEVVVPTRFILPPGPREGIVVNLAEMRLYYYPDTPQGATPRVETYPIGVGRMDWQTPLGRTTITAKIEDPAWYPPQSIIEERARRGETLPRVVPPGPDNPLGEHALILDLPGYLIHGTNRPAGVGMRVSHGCIRMLPGDIADLIHRVPVGTAVRLIDQPVKLGWTSRGTLEVQSHPVLETTPEARSERIAETFAAVTEAANQHGVLVDYARLQELAVTADGIPHSVMLTEAPFEVPYHFYDQLVLAPSLYHLIEASPAQETRP